MPVGYYEVTFPGKVKSSRITVGVLEPLRAPTPLDSPIGIDVALAWCFPKEQWGSAVNFCELAGMNRVRDRMSWEELEPKRGRFAANTRYDESLKIQTDAGLQVLQVNHIAASWANRNSSKHFPPDLRDIYNSYREFARRWRGKIAAFEPWNEADIPDFGGQTGDEIASLQKAAYLGLKAGNPDLTVCQNVFAHHRQTTLRNFSDNRAGAYFDIFDLHHYEPLENYPKIYEDFRAVAEGKPLWVTECNVTVEWSGDEQRKEPSDENLRVQSERVAKIYAEAIHEGARAVFYFMLPHYTERKVQYGVLHPDLTPRPAFMAVAATGRLLAAARPLGRVEAKDKGIHGYLFAAKPDGKPAEVLVIWSDGPGEFELPEPPVACFDHLGRRQVAIGKTLKLTRAPIFAVLDGGARPALIAPPEAAKASPEKPVPIVLQAVLPEQDIVLKKSAYKMAVNSSNTVPVYLYNFGTTAVHGRLNVAAPENWSAEFAGETDLAPGERKEMPLILKTGKDWDMAARVQINGDFGGAGQCVLALRFVSSSAPP